MARYAGGRHSTRQDPRNQDSTKPANADSRACHTKPLMSIRDRHLWCREAQPNWTQAHVVRGGTSASISDRIFWHVVKFRTVILA